MIKVNRRGSEVKVTYFNEIGGSRVAVANTYSIETAKELVIMVKKAIILDYGFAKCRAILEGDSI